VRGIADRRNGDLAVHVLSCNMSVVAEPLSEKVIMLECVSGAVLPKQVLDRDA